MSNYSSIQTFIDDVIVQLDKLRRNPDIKSPDELNITIELLSHRDTVGHGLYRYELDEEIHKLLPRRLPLFNIKQKLLTVFSLIQIYRFYHPSEFENREPDDTLVPLDKEIVESKVALITKPTPDKFFRSFALYLHARTETTAAPNIPFVNFDAMRQSFNSERNLDETYDQVRSRYHPIKWIDNLVNETKLDHAYNSDEQLKVMKLSFDDWIKLKHALWPSEPVDYIRSAIEAIKRCQDSVVTNAVWIRLSNAVRSIEVNPALEKKEIPNGLPLQW